jgi:hypothetical protein
MRVSLAFDAMASEWNIGCWRCKRSHTSVSIRWPFSRIWITASSSLEVPNSASRVPLAAES